MSQPLAPCAEHEWPTEGLHPSSGLPGVSLKSPAPKAPHGRELGFQQTEEEVALSACPAVSGNPIQEAACGSVHGSAVA